MVSLGHKKQEVGSCVCCPLTSPLTLSSAVQPGHCDRRLGTMGVKEYSRVVI